MYTKDIVSPLAIPKFDKQFFQAHHSNWHMCSRLTYYGPETFGKFRNTLDGL